jgi:hypothetical protein
MSRQTADCPPYKDDRPPKGVNIRETYDLERLPTSFSLAPLHLKALIHESLC